jgi:uncharacterized HAD superfamily protein
MRIGFDLDEVVVSLTKEFEVYLKNKYDIYWPIEKFKFYSLNNCVYIDDKDKNKEIVAELMELADDSDFQLTAKPCEGAVQVLKAIKKSGHKIFFLSSRPRVNHKNTIAWLRKYNIPFDGVEIIGKQAEKGPYGKKLQLDMYVDDLEYHLLNMYKYKNRWKKGLLLMSRPWNKGSIDGTK